MWKITRKLSFAIVDEEEFTDFQEAKIQFRNAIKDRVGRHLPKFIKQIEGYCKKYYPLGHPDEFDLLKDLLCNIVTNPDYPENPEVFNFLRFEDDNVEFYMDETTKEIVVRAKKEELSGEFPYTEINAILLDDPKGEYYFFFTNKYRNEYTNHYSTDITLYCDELKNDEINSDNEDLEDESEELYSDLVIIESSYVLGISIKKERLLTKEEIEKYKKEIPRGDVYDRRENLYFPNKADMPKSEFRELGVLCYTDGRDIYSRVALDIENADKTNLVVGDKFLYETCFFTLIDKNLAVSTDYECNFEFE